jgi:hypothetical protein
MAIRVAEHNGAPALFINDRPVFAGYLWESAPGAEGYPGEAVARRYAEAGIHLHAFEVGAYGGTPEWGAAGFDFSQVEAQFGRVLDADPEALFHLRMYLELDGGSPWWLDRYPDECEVDSDGNRPTQSYASLVWQEQAKDFLRQYSEHLRTIGLADRVLAYQTGAGHAGEWVKGQTSMRRPCGDFSAPMRRHFRSWLRQRYDGDVDAFRSAWNDPEATFATAAVPPEAAQLNTLHGCFRDPRRERPVIDYYRCLAELCGDLVIDLNRTVKEANGGRVLTGAFYGYLTELAWNAGFFGEGPDSDYSTYQRSGHLGLARVLRSPYVDFLVSPYSYGFRGVGGHGCAMPPSESLRLHGKLYLFEEDSRTYLTQPDAGFGRTDSPAETEAVLKRNFAEVLTRGMGMWWLGRPGHIDPVQGPEIGDLLGKFMELGAFGLRLDRRPSAEIAVLLDDESLLYQSVRNDLDVPLIFQQRLWGLPRLGAPCDYYLLQDLLEDRLKPYKLYIFLNAFHLDASRRRALARQLQRDGRVALWIYAPGYLQDEPSLDQMAEVTGFTFSQGEHAWGPLMHVTDFDHPITSGLAQDLVWGTNSRLAPLFHLQDAPDTRVLGRVVYSQGRCRPGLGVRAFPDWTSIYSAAPNLPAPVLRGMARFAGVHLYSEAGDVLHVAPQLLGAHTVSGGQRIFALPERAERVYDLFGDREVARDADRFQVTLEPASTALYYTGEAALLEDWLVGR